MAKILLSALKLADTTHAEAVARRRQLARAVQATVRIGFPGAMFAVPPDPPGPRTMAADRTRSVRWRAGTRRHKRRVLEERRRRVAAREKPGPLRLDVAELGWHRTI